MSEAEYRVFSDGYLKTPEDLETISLTLLSNGNPLLLSEVADIQYEPALRRQVADLNGQGEATGGIIVMRYGENANQTIESVKQKLGQLKKRIPKGVEIVEIYDRSKLINRAIDNLWQTLTLEWVIIGLVCLLFLGSLSSAFVAIVSLPIGILIAFCLMRFQDINANILSLGGIAIAIGTMVDGAIVMVEQAYRSVQKEQGTKPHWQIIKEASTKTGPAVFFSLLIITLSFLPVFILEGEISRLFTPLAHTKTSAMLAAALLSITLVPVLMGFFLRKVKPAKEKSSKTAMIYLSILGWVFKNPKKTLTAFALLLLISLKPASELHEEFMPPLDEGDWMYMPTTATGISIEKAREVLQKAHRSIKQVPEVDHVFGKVGRADTATDIAPLTMIESFVQLKPKSEWRDGLKPEKIKANLNQKVTIPSVTNAWVMPIKGRIDMLSTGIKTPLGLKISGPDLSSIETTGREIEKQLKTLPTTTQVYADKPMDARYIAMEVNRINAARYNLSVSEIQSIIQVAVNGQEVSTVIDNEKRFTIKLKVDRNYQSDIEGLKQFPFITSEGKHLLLGDVVNIKVQNGPAMIKSENARLQSLVFIETQQTDNKNYIQQANRLFDTLEFPQGVTIQWAGQYQAFERLKEKLFFLIPLILLGIILLLWFGLRNISSISIVIISLPIGLAGSLWLISSLDFALSVAVIVGIIAMAGIAIETVLIMLMFLKDAWNDLTIQNQEKRSTIKLHQLEHSLKQAAVLRSRPLLMTVVADLAGLIPILLSTGTGSEIMQRLAAPMIGGLITTLLMTLFLTPLLFYLFKSYSVQKAV
jgi:Cu(I)/Ag(I) efflux system membrane protein CusA/SilA